MCAFWNLETSSSTSPTSASELPGRGLPGAEDSIAALATPPGRSALALIRLSGPNAFTIGGRLIRPWPVRPRQAVLCRVYDPDDGTIIDQLVVSCYPAPRSYTGEDMLEFSSHGGHAVPEALLGALMRVGAREALPGEFTRRAVLNGKLDLMQAEAVGDLIDASSDTMRRVVLHQLDGGLSKQIEDLRKGVLEIEALLAYDIDFPEEDDGPISRTRVEGATTAVLTTLDALLETAPATELVRDGAIVVIAGRPNVGKSSLFNALLGEARAIVTDIPGTTRDAIEARVQFGRWPVRLVDTAGLRSTDEIVERLGIEVSERYLANAHAIVACDDDLDRLHDTAVLVRSLSAALVIEVLTKCDQPARRANAAAELPGASENVLRVSARDRSGLASLTQSVGEILETRYGVVPVSRPALTRTRQQIAVQRARDELAMFLAHWQDDSLPASINAVHIRHAVSALDELIGAVDIEDVLERVFSTFCVGK
jgi:tRNA modification GTPase